MPSRGEDNRILLQHENHVTVRHRGMYSAESTDDFGASMNGERRGVNSAEAGATSRG
jgi:hypothetical protein